MASEREWQSVSSEAIRSIRHEDGRTIIEFTDRTVYSYRDSRKTIYKNLKDGNGAGGRFNRKYRNTRRPIKRAKRR